MEGNSTLYRVNFINEYPIALDMAVKRPFPFAMKRVVTAFRRQRLFVDDQAHYLGKFTNILAALLHIFAFFFERYGKPRFEHRLVVRVQIHQHFFKRIVQFGGNFAPHHRPAFPYSSGGFGIGSVAFGAQRTFAFKIKSVICGYLWFSSRGKSEDYLSCRYLRRNFNSNQAVGRYFYRLFDGHKVSVA
jgi:hypothetical protein